MIRKLIATSVASLMTISCAHASADPLGSADVSPATVVVTFDRDSITPLIVEGVRNRVRGEAVEANDPVRIASISKLIMALATLRLVDEGKVDLDADVSDYLGWQVRSPNFPDAKVTLAQLLSHRSGLRDNAGYVIPLGESLEAKLAEPEAWYADSPPGEAPFEYANLGSPVVATVIEAATGERYDRIVERTVFAPLDVKACFNWVGCDDDMIARAVTLYRDTGEVARDEPSDLPPNCTVPVSEGTACDLASYVPGSNASIFSPQGGGRIGMMDLVKIGQALMLSNDGGLFEAATFDRLASSIMAGANEDQEFFCTYGLGIQLLEMPDRECLDALFETGIPYLGHAGEAYGLRSGLWFSGDGMGGFAYFTTAVPPRQGAEDEGGFSQREKDLMKRAQALLAEQNSN